MKTQLVKLNQKSLRCALKEANVSVLLHMNSEDLKSAWVSAQPDLSLTRNTRNFISSAVHRLKSFQMSSGHLHF